MASALYVDDIYLGGKGGMPIGAVYMQLPDTPDPSELFTGTWENVSTGYAGDFFRVEGENALAFGGGQQGDAFQEHAHNPHPDMSGFLMYDGTGGGSGANTWYKRGKTGTAVEPDTGSWGIPRTDIETRPINQTMRVWKRIS